MNDPLLDLATAAPWLSRRPRHAPEALTIIWCRPTPDGALLFAWRPPPGRTRVDGYRLERTREGRDYETLLETRNEHASLPPVALNDPWFYRLSAFNARGQGPARRVFFFLRRERNSMFLRVPVRPGLRVVINEFLPA